MRNQPGDGADQRSTRRRDQAPDRDGQGGRPPVGGSVFAPGYDATGAEQPDNSAGQRHSSPGMTWYGSTAGGTASKGPVRGFPPRPGQPPPMYPPGQFAAWNRQGPRTGRAGEASQDPGPATGQPTRMSGPHTGPGTSGPGRVNLDGPRNGLPGSAGPGGARSRYYNQDAESGAEPGYPVLAVSDPAADVTSTQTWQAVGEGRATGVWTAPARPDRDPAASPGRGGANGGDATAISRRSAVLDPRGRTATQPGAAMTDSVGAVEQGRRGSRGHSGAHTSPNQVPRAPRRAAGSAATAAPELPAGPQPRRKRAGGLRFAVVAAVALVLGAAAALTYAVLHHGASPKPAAARRPAVSPSVSASPTPSLGQYGHIATRKSDPTPLTMSALYPVSFTASGSTVARTAESKGTDCAAELVGSRIQTAIGSAGCSQVVRATYLASGPGVMGTIGVLNLSTAKAATTVARTADANDFVSQLPGKHGATTKIGQGTGIEEAAAKGHYLILIWAEFTNLRKPRTPAQLATVEQFMNELLKNTANVNLTQRMLSGTP